MKLRRGTPREETKGEGKLAALPVKLCDPHPDLQTRLRYDQVDELAKDIKAHGLLQPGRAVKNPDGTRYWVYQGIGRLFAVKKLFEEYGEPKSYLALLDEGLSFVELFSRSMSENLKRRNLSVLEEVRSFDLASQRAGEDEIVAASSKIGEDPRVVRRRIELAGILGDKLGKLYEVEARARPGFSFQIGHLEALSKVEGRKELFQAAAATAVARFSVKELQSSLLHNSIDKVVSGLPEWFDELFPEYAEAGQGSGGTRVIEMTGSVTASPAARDKPAMVSITARRAPGSQPPAGVTYKENLPFVGCPRCGAQAPFEMKEDSELTLIRFRGTAVPVKDSVEPEGSYRRLCECLNPDCGEEFWLWVSVIDGELRVEAKRRGEEGWFSVPAGKPRVGSVGWDGGRRSWVVKEKGGGRAYLYGEDGKFVAAGP